MSEDERYGRGRPDALRDGGGRDIDGETGSVPSEVRDSVDELDEAELRGLIRYASERLESETRKHAKSQGNDSQTGDGDECPEGVPSKATRVVKEINDNRYYYWQWRDGDSVKSKYDRPAGPE